MKDKITKKLPLTQILFLKEFFQEKGAKIF